MAEREPEGVDRDAVERVDRELSRIHDAFRRDLGQHRNGRRAARHLPLARLDDVQERSDVIALACLGEQLPASLPDPLSLRDTGPLDFASYPQPWRIVPDGAGRAGAVAANGETLFIGRVTAVMRAVAAVNLVEGGNK